MNQLPIQTKTAIIEIIQSHLRSFDMATNDSEIKMQIDESLQWLEKIRQSYKLKEAKQDESDKLYQKHTEVKKDV